ncbi:MAG: hypothetical protein MR964_04675 [Campylobacter sp.]|uniref:hypothetical protein n=1 Tax=Campylobacter sp. TaxID=205 RepID=UPI002AA67A29|nr:hypothetical protein [Campylobacter sp.]MCI7023504.1 hypothetical protein [Campylobacter sp.]
MALLNDVSTNEVVQNDTNSISAANVEQYTNYAQYLNLLLTPFGDKYPKLVGAYGVLSGQTGVVGSGADLTQKTQFYAEPKRKLSNEFILKKHSAI